MTGSLNISRKNKRQKTLTTGERKEEDSLMSQCAASTTFQFFLWTDGQLETASE